MKVVEKNGGQIELIVIASVTTRYYTVIRMNYLKWNTL